MAERVILEVTAADVRVGDEILTALLAPRWEVVRGVERDADDLVEAIVFARWRYDLGPAVPLFVRRPAPSTVEPEGAGVRPFDPCTCRTTCGDTSDELGTCKILPRRPERPPVEFVLERRLPAVEHTKQEESEGAPARSTETPEADR